MKFLFCIEDRGDTIATSVFILKFLYFSEILFVYKKHGKSLDSNLD